MKSLTKRIFCIVCILALVISSVGCKAVDNEESKAGNGNIKDEVGYNQELASYFTTVEGTVLKYYGTAEYGQTLTLNKALEDEDSLKLIFKGEIQDLSEGEGASKDELMLESEYLINKDSVKETIKNEEIRFSQSIIREQIILKAPIEEGTSWKQTVSIDGKEYEAETKIIEVSKDEKDRNLVKTETNVKDIESYPENTYKEIRAYKEGKGLVEFSNTIILKGPQGEEPIPFEFGYRLYEEE
ncbi:hypothetical protein [Paramaledivibacter caminithermalis]|uniref:Lipoprotein n=1 Tax=Paramaledivibacter caminithermalis (strain DSM 15212 / CIP 107654 / DViRD3) TaxID=1121301 RepID=A0A1M6P812_PARC5|nr:hypothetical protein [Paramaledivibacter caminithermalis]SHK04040.1 hypothetical protein SAMN02745912_02042 [Paramaledivibacter caminithermalis DSM 15212]